MNLTTVVRSVRKGALSGLSVCAVLPLAASPALANMLLAENFDDITTLSGSGWVFTNNSFPLGSTGWFQGNAGVFPAHAGAPNAYIAANFNNADFGGNISNWLLSPTLALADGDTIEFYTRTESPALFADRLELRLSTNGASTNVGLTDTSLGDFTALLLSINPTLDPSGYPDSWTPLSVTLSGLGGPISGRFGFRYDVPDTSINADYIGIDTVSVSSGTSVPEPGTLAMLVVGLAGLAGLAGQRRRSGPKSKPGDDEEGTRGWFQGTRLCWAIL